MNIVFFAHPPFLGSQSMSRYASWLSKGMKIHNHSAEIWAPKGVMYKLPLPANIKKWMGYIDQYILFPIWVKKEIKKQPQETLYVLTDNALGPWVPLVKKQKHIIHCHDFLAQSSALGQIMENPTSWTGKQYQAYIRRGYIQSKNFISISKKTQEDLHKFLNSKPLISEIVYNGLTQSFINSNDRDSIRHQISEEIGIDVSKGFILHVGGNQWYKNRIGVLEIYDSWRQVSKQNLPLLMIGSTPSQALKQYCSTSDFKSDIHFFTGKSDEFVKHAYAAASVFLFPSLAEGFGWPIAEAMASGTPVVTTNQNPMTEVAGNAAILIDRRPTKTEDTSIWSNKAAHAVDALFNLSYLERQEVVKKGLENIKRFDSADRIAEIEKIYLAVVSYN